MKKKTLRLIIRIVAVLACIGLVATVFIKKMKKDNGLDGNEWFARQYEYMNQFTGFCLNMDEVYALYISNDMTEADFLIEYAILLNQWDILEASYIRFLKENPVRPNGHSYVSRRGEGAITDLRNTINKILESTKNGNAIITQDEILYMYLSYKQDIQMSLAEYTVAYQWIQARDMKEKDYEKMIDEYAEYLKDEMFDTPIIGTEEETSATIIVVD